MVKFSERYLIELANQKRIEQEGKEVEVYDRQRNY